MSPAMAGFLEHNPEARDGVLGAIPLGFIGDCENDVGPAVVWLCSDAASYVDGHEPVRRRRAGLRPVVTSAGAGNPPAWNPPARNPCPEPACPEPACPAGPGDDKALISSPGCASIVQP